MGVDCFQSWETDKLALWRERLPNIRGCEEPPAPEARGGGQKDQSHVQGAVAARVQEGLEELSHVEGQEGRW